MATVTFREIHQAVLYMCKDRNLRTGDIDPYEIQDSERRSLAYVDSQLNRTATRVTTFLTLAANLDNYAVNALYFDLSALNGFRLVSIGEPIRKVDLPELEHYRTGNPVLTGDPLLIAFTEALAGTYTAYLWPTPWQADTVDATYVGSLSLGTNNIETTGGAIYEATLDMPGDVRSAVEYHAAGELLIGRDKIQSDTWLTLADKMIRVEAGREHRFRRPSAPRMQNAF